MNKSESIEDLAKKYKDIFWRNHGGNPSKCFTGRYMTNFLIEFAGAIEHHLSSERAVEAAMVDTTTAGGRESGGNPTGC